MRRIKGARQEGLLFAFEGGSSGAFAAAGAAEGPAPHAERSSGSCGFKLQ